MLDRLLALAVPPACTACRLPLAAAADPLCPACRRALPWLPAARCPRCALPSPCAPCPAARAPWTAAWAPLAYAGPARALVAALKFRGATALADLMAAQMIATAPPGLLDGAALGRCPPIRVGGGRVASTTPSGSGARWPPAPAGPCAAA